MAEQDGFTPQEAAYFESGGAQTEGLTDVSPSSSEPVQQQQQEAAQQQQQEQQPAEQRTVPLAALQEERAERKRLRDEVQQMRANQDALMQRILASQQPQTAQQEPQVQIPDYATDPVGNLRAQLQLQQQQFQQVVGYLSGQEQQTQQVTQQQRAVQEVQNYLVTEEAAYRQQAPDYDAAANFLQQSRIAEYRALGIVNPMQIQQMLQQDIIGMTNIARQNGANPADAFYNLAKARGYKGAQGGQQAQQDAAARLATVAQGQQHAQSLSGTGGAAPSPMSMEKLLAMDDAEFAKATSGMNWQKLNAELSR